MSKRECLCLVAIVFLLAFGSVAGGAVLFSDDLEGDAIGATPSKFEMYDHSHNSGSFSMEVAEDPAGESGNVIHTFGYALWVQKQPGDNVGSVVFQVFVDGEKRFDSGVMRGNDPAIPISISVASAYELRLVVTDAGDGITCDCSNWADARLIRDPSVETRMPEEPLDIAPFARIVTWDPGRTDGCRCSRVEEKPICRVTVNGVNHTGFDSAKECIRIKPLDGAITVRAEY